MGEFAGHTIHRDHIHRILLEGVSAGSDLSRRIELLEHGLLQRQQVETLAVDVAFREQRRRCADHIEERVDIAFEQGGERVGGI